MVTFAAQQQLLEPGCRSSKYWSKAAAVANIGAFTTAKKHTAKSCSCANFARVFRKFAAGGPAEDALHCQSSSCINKAIWTEAKNVFTSREYSPLRQRTAPVFVMVEGTEEGPFAQMSIAVTLYRLAYSKSPLQANRPLSGNKEKFIALKRMKYAGRVYLSLHHILDEKST